MDYKLADRILDILKDNNHKFNSDHLMAYNLGNYDDVESASLLIKSIIPQMVEYEDRNTKQSKDFVIQLDPEFRFAAGQILKTGGLEEYARSLEDDMLKKKEREDAELSAWQNSIETNKKTIVLAEKANEIANAANILSSVANDHADSANNRAKDAVLWAKISAALALAAVLVSIFKK